MNDTQTVTKTEYVVQWRIKGGDPSWMDRGTCHTKKEAMTDIKYFRSLYWESEEWRIVERTTIDKVVDGT